MWTLSGFADEIDPDFETQCAHLNSLQVEWLELRSAWGVNVLDLDDKQRAEAKRILDEHGIKVSSIGSPIGKIGIIEDFAPHLERFEHCLKVAKEFDAPYIRLFSFFIPAGDDPATHKEEVLRRMQSLGTAAQGKGVTLLHENEKEIYGDTPERCVQIFDAVEAIAPDTLKLIFDPANFVQCDVRPVTDGYDQIRPHLAYVHVKDALFADDSVVPAGEGDGEVRELVRRLKDDGFDGFFSLEPHLADQGSFGGFSGPDLWTKAHGAFTALLDEEGISYL